MSIDNVAKDIRLHLEEVVLPAVFEHGQDCHGCQKLSCEREPHGHTAYSCAVIDNAMHPYCCPAISGAIAKI